MTHAPESNQDGTGFRPLQVATIVVVVVTVAGGSWLISAAESHRLIDGAVAWHQESPLRAVVQLLSLNYQFATPNAGDVKMYLLGLGAGLGALVIGIAAMADRREPNVVQADSLPRVVGRRAHVTPLHAAQLLALGYLVWSFASSRWSNAPSLAVGASLLLTIHFLWPFVLSVGLHVSAAHLVARLLVPIAGITGLLAVWYYYGRNPVLRAKFPFGNPNFLAACLIPGALLSLSWCSYAMGRLVKQWDRTAIGVMAGSMIAIALIGWAFAISQSRGPALGLAVGLGTMVFLRTRWRGRVACSVVVLAMLAGAGSYFLRLQDTTSSTGRSATIRFRLYAWDYAWHMFVDRPAQGHGQSAYVLTGDTFVPNDVLKDPTVFEARIAHAHSEWLEVLADLGAVGLVLIAAILAMTMRAGMLALQRATLTHAQQWSLVGLMASLVALVVEEAFGVGLRVSGVSTFFFTVIGLIWAMSATGQGWESLAMTRRGWRMVVCIVAGTSGLMAVILSQEDFAAARSAYRADTSLVKGEFEEAARLAGVSTSRLNPQRALRNVFRLSEAHMLAAGQMQDRALDRRSRAQRSDILDPNLMNLSQADFETSNDHLHEATAALKELVSRAPGYFNHGRIEFSINMLRARAASARGDREQESLALSNAAAAAERELLRQPFNPDIVLEYLSAAGRSVDPDAALSLLARTLRHHRLTSAYVDALDAMAENPDFDGVLLRATGAAGKNVTVFASGKGDLADPWTMEKLRLVAAFHFRRGNYGVASEALALAVSGYEALSGVSALAFSSALAEWADCRFFDKPADAAKAIETAQRAIQVAPQSLMGRQLQKQVKQRLVTYSLAADDEAGAIRLLDASRPAGVTDDDLMVELGSRYRRLCEAVLGRREALLLRKPPAAMVPKLQRWLARAMALNERDGQAPFLAADLALYAGDCTGAAGYLQRSLELGLPQKAAEQFLALARERNPSCQQFDTISELLEKETPESSKHRSQTRSDEADKSPPSRP